MNLIDGPFMPFGVNLAHARRKAADDTTGTDEARGSTSLQLRPEIPESSTLLNTANPEAPC
jgi:hypothetical protein